MNRLNQSILIFLVFPTLLISCQRISPSVSNPDQSSVPGNIQANLSIKPTSPIKSEAKQSMRLLSSAFAPDQNIPPEYTCDGENINPPLTIQAIPPHTQSLALIVDDPDASSGDWVHWLVWNIDPQTQSIDSNQVPSAATQGVNDFGQNNYAGPCPPSGTHRYQFSLYALDIKLNLPENTRKSTLLETIQDHLLAQTKLVGLYQKQ